MIASMTGYARADGGDDALGWSWELRSVNARGLDTRARLSTPFDRLDGEVRQRVAKVLTRGTVSITLSVRAAGVEADYTVNEAFLARLIAAARRHIEPGDAPPRPEWLMAVRGVVEAAQPDARAAEAPVPAEAMLASLDDALAGLLAARRDEGARLQAILTDQIDRLAGHVAGLRNLASQQMQGLRTRLHQQVAELVGDHGSPVPEERLAHEIALMATKADIREELDRLDAHVAQARALMAAGGPVGRRLDFLCQEFNREANTVCSKSADIEVTRIGLELKAVIDQIREQVQNIE